MIWRMRIGHYRPETQVVLVDGRIDPATFVTEEFRQRYAYPGMTDEDLFCLTFFDFSHSIKVALLDECPLSPQEVHARGAAVYARAGEERTRQSRERGKRRRAMNGYLQFCEDLYNSWLEDRLADSDANWEEPELLKELTNRTVNLYFAPEPYLVFDEVDIHLSDKPRLIFLTTNPGGGNAYQTRNSARAASCSTYAQFLDHVQGRYEGMREKGDKENAGERIKNMQILARELYSQQMVSTPGFIQCEVVPFHSNSLPNKHKLASYIEGGDKSNPLVRYVAHLQSFLSCNNVIAIDGCNFTTKDGEGKPRPLADDEIWHAREIGTDQDVKDEARWIAWKSRLFDFDVRKVGLGPSGDRHHRLGKNNPQKNGVRFYGHWSEQNDQKLLRGYYLAQGNNNLGEYAKEIINYLASR